MTQSRSDSDMQARKTRIMLAGAGLGALIGCLSSYLYTRAAAEHANSETGAPEPVSTGQLLAILLAVLGLVRQIAALGKPSKKRRK